MNDQSGNTAQPWYDSEEHFATQLEGRLAQQLGRALLDATAAQIRSEMAQGRAAALGERVVALGSDVAELKDMVDRLSLGAARPNTPPAPVKGAPPAPVKGRRR